MIDIQKIVQYSASFPTVDFNDIIGKERKFVCYVMTYCFKDVENGLSDLEVRQRAIRKRTQPLLEEETERERGWSSYAQQCELLCKLTASTVRMPHSMNDVCRSDLHTQNNSHISQTFH